MISSTALIVMAGVSLLGAASGVIGCFAVLRRRALTGDALAHAALPGLCVAVLVVGGRHLPMMLLGAFVSGLLGIGVIAGLRQRTRIKSDAAIGIVLSVFFGVGVVLGSLIQRLSVGGRTAGLENYILGNAAGMLPRDVYQLGTLAIISGLMVLILFKEFRLLSFDPDFARSQGWPTGLLDFLMMALIGAAVVLGLPAVGVVLIVALLILPGATARFWTDRLHRMLWLAALIGAASGAVGTILSTTFPELKTGPIITLVGTGFFVLSALFSPRRGLLARMMRPRIREEMTASCSG